MRLLFVGMAFWCVVGESSAAQVRQFPYEAVVDADEIYVRSGPGSKYYPTTKLKRDARVTVHRHDPGGWFMISPPPGSFSWIRADYVRKTNGDRGVLTENNVVVRVGSEFGDVRDIEQRRLSNGDEVEIIDEKMLSSETGPVRMYAIKPPQGEYRWVPGQSVSPIDEALREQRDRDPFALPTEVLRSGDLPTPPGSPQRGGSAATSTKQPDTQQSISTSSNTAVQDRNEAFGERPLVRTQNNEVVRRSIPDSNRLQQDRARLRDIDERFRMMIQEDVGQWDIDRLEQEYRALRESVAHPALASQIDLRFDAVARYQRIQAEYDDFVQITEETSRRDAQLLSMQRKPGQSRNIATQPASSQPQRPEPSPEPRFEEPSPRNRQPQEIPQPLAPQPAPRQSSPAPAEALQPNEAQRERPSPTNTDRGPQPGAPQQARKVPQFAGAGIIQRAAVTIPNGPQHVLLAPNGRILAYLKGGPEIELDRFVGQAMGVQGPRAFRNDLQSDFIEVQGLSPVRLVP